MTMKQVRMWALWRRFQYGIGYTLCLMLVATGVYYRYVYEAPTCFDEVQNGSEDGVDCGGACKRICAFTVKPPVVQWAKSFPANPGQYNAVAYVENSNRGAGTPALKYTFTLKDRSGIITTRSGSTILPPYSTYPIFEGRIDTAGRIPTETIIELEPIDLWVPDTSSEAQFRSGESSLTGADTAPRLSASIENTFLTDATDVEVVATIFDAQGTPLTASQTFVDSVPGQQSKPVTFTWPQPIAKTLRSCTVPTDVIVAIDLSGSMNNDGGTPPQPVTAVLAAARSFVSELHPGDQVGIVTFASEALLRSGLSSSTARGATMIAGFAIDPKEEKGTTNTGEAIKAAARELASERHNGNARKVVVLLTDGLATAPGDKPNDFALAAARELKSTGTTLFTIGLGASVDQTFLSQLASAPEQSYIAPTTATLNTIYQNITASICEEGAARIDVIPKAANFVPLQ